MSITASAGEKKEYPIAPAGTHVATIYKIMNLGSRLQEFQGVQKDYPDTLINITVELNNELNKFTVKNEDGTEEEKELPFVLSREFTLSMHEKSNLRPFVEGVIGVQLKDEEASAFDIEDLLGKSFLVTVVHNVSKANGKTYANIATAAPLMKGMEAPTPINDQVILDVRTMKHEEIDTLPQFLQDKIKVSYEYKNRFEKTDGEEVESPF